MCLRAITLAEREENKRDYEKYVKLWNELIKEENTHEQDIYILNEIEKIPFYNRSLYA